MKAPYIDLCLSVAQFKSQSLQYEFITTMLKVWNSGLDKSIVSRRL